MNKKGKQLRGKQNVTIVGFKDFTCSEEMKSELSKKNVMSDYTYFFNYLFIKKQYYTFTSKNKNPDSKLNFKRGIPLSSLMLKENVPNYSEVVNVLAFTKNNQSSDKLYRRIPYSEKEVFKYSYFKESKPKLKFVTLKNNTILTKMYSETLKYKLLRKNEIIFSEDLEEVKFLFGDYKYINVDFEALNVHLEDLLDNGCITYEKYVMLYIKVVDVINGYYTFKRDKDKDGRLHSAFQQTGKICRKFMRLDNKVMYEVDVSAAVPSILAFYLSEINSQIQNVTLKQKFISDNEDFFYQQKLKELFSGTKLKNNLIDKLSNKMQLKTIYNELKETSAGKSIVHNLSSKSTTCLNLLNYSQYMFQNLAGTYFPNVSATHTELNNCNIFSDKRCNTLFEDPNKDPLVTHNFKSFKLISNVLSVKKENIVSCLYNHNQFLFDQMNFKKYSQELELYKTLIMTDSLYEKIGEESLKVIEEKLCNINLELNDIKSQKLEGTVIIKIKKLEKRIKKLEKSFLHYTQLKNDILIEPRLKMKKDFLSMLNAPHNLGKYMVVRNAFERLFPTLSIIVKKIKTIDEVRLHKLFSALVLQKEGELILTKVCKEFKEMYGDCRLLTIHDCIITTSEYYDKLEAYMKSRLSELLKIEVNVKGKKLTLDLE